MLRTKLVIIIGISLLLCSGMVYAMPIMSSSTQSTSVNTGIEPTTAPKMIAYDCGSDDFSGTAINTSKWNGPNSNINGSVDIINGEARLSIPGGHIQGGFSGISSKKMINGDFSTEVVLKSMSTTNNKNTGTLALFFHTNSSKSLKFYRQTGRTTLLMGVNNGTAGNDWSFEEKEIGRANNTPVKLKIERVGNTVKMLYDLLDGNNYQLARQVNNFYTGDGWITIAIESTPPDLPQMNGLIDDFKLTCYCPLRSKGDANCDQVVNSLDFDVFKSQLQSVGNNVLVDPNPLSSADFNNDRKVNILDFEIWRNAFLK